MRTIAQILSDFDDPSSATPPINTVDSTTNSVRDRVLVETMLDIRAQLVAGNAELALIKAELVTSNATLLEVKAAIEAI